jgi:hypothetical protein
LISQESLRLSPARPVELEAQLLEPFTALAPRLLYQERAKSL